MFPERPDLGSSKCEFHCIEEARKYAYNLAREGADKAMEIIDIATERKIVDHKFTMPKGTLKYAVVRRTGKRAPGTADEEIVDVHHEGEINLADLYADTKWGKAK